MADETPGEDLGAGNVFVRAQPPLKRNDCKNVASRNVGAGSGLALSLFLGFRYSQAYNRWWKRVFSGELW